MVFGYKQDWTLAQVVSRCPEKLLDDLWLLVALDSARGERLHAAYQFLRRDLPANAIWTRDGIQMSGRELQSVRQARFITPFSAAYVFPAGLDHISVLYISTSESDTFDASVPPELERMFATSGLHAYFADGTGLNFCVADKSFLPFGDAMEKREP